MKNKNPDLEAPGFHRLVVAILFLAGTLGGLGAAPADAQAAEARLGERIDLDLEAAPAEQVLSVFAQVLGATPEIEPDVQGEISITLFNVTARTALNATCESLGCRWRLVPGDPARLIVEPLPQPRGPEPDRDASLSLELDRVAARDAFETLARVSGLSVVLEPGVEGEISLTLAERKIDEILDRFCQQIDCRWQIQEGSDGAVLRVEPR